MITSCESDWKSLACNSARREEIQVQERVHTWSILTIEPQRENTAAAFLVGRGLKPYNPTFQQRIRSAPSCNMPYRTVDRPIFSGYMFLRNGASGPDWPVIRSSAGVRGVLSSNGKPATLSEDAIKVIREVEEKYRQRDKKRSKHALIVGMRVRVDRRLDAFHGMEGVLQRLDRRDRAVVLLMMPGRNAWPIRVAARWLKEA